ncbi:MAG: hypothetical protein MJ099_06340, partial [Clostridia bacterium]|nr:hypothetical protein [Clostridia bacterium]
LVTVTVMIRSENLGVAWRFYGTMFGINGARLWDPTATLLLREYGLFIAGGVVFGLPVGQWLRNRFHVSDTAIRVVSGVGLLAFTVIAMSYVAVVDYNPFIYFNF